jgi:hypothetical protein
LENLIGSPDEVGGNFGCTNSKLKSLKGSPKIVDGHFVCSYNSKLQSIDGFETEVNGNFVCYDTPNLSQDELLKLKESGLIQGDIFSDYGQI